MTSLHRTTDQDMVLCHALRQAAERHGLVLDWDSPRPRQPKTLGELLARQDVLLDLPAHVIRSAADRQLAQRLAARLVPAPTIDEAPARTPAAAPVEPLTIRLKPRAGGAA